MGLGTWGWASNQQRDRLHQKFTWTCKKPAGSLHSLEVPSLSALPVEGNTFPRAPTAQTCLTLTRDPTQPVVELLVSWHTCCCLHCEAEGKQCPERQGWLGTDEREPQWLHLPSTRSLLGLCLKSNPLIIFPFTFDLKSVAPVLLCMFPPEGSLSVPWPEKCLNLILFAHG